MNAPDFRPFALERYFAAHEHAVPHQLSASDCEPLLLGGLLAACGGGTDELLALRLGYTESRGAKALREAIAAHHEGCGPDDVLVANAPQEAIAVAMQAALQPGDRVVVQTPCYQSLAELPRQLGCEVAPWALRRCDAGFAIDWDTLDRLLLLPARMVVTNFPHNPTGLQPSRAAFERLAARIAASGALWFSDEMYRGLAPDDGAELPPAASLSPRALSLWGLSKTFGLPGLRLGWLVCRDRDLLEHIEARKDYTSICTNAVAEHAARLALRNSVALIGRNRARIAGNAARMAAFAAEHRDLLAFEPPQAGPTGLARLHRGTASAMADLVRAHGALLVPSRLFDLEDRWLRIGLGRDGFDLALARWAAALRAGRD